jgi:hypothetical protein
MRETSQILPCSGFFDGIFGFYNMVCHIGMLIDTSYERLGKPLNGFY